MIVFWGIVIRFVAVWLVRRFFRYSIREDRLAFSERRARTLEGLLTGLTTFSVIVVAAIWAILSLGILHANVLFPVLGLFSAGFGLGARPLVSDYLAGLTLLFEHSYGFGDKVEILEVIGTVEHVGLRITEIRGDRGELFVVPNGDVRLIRNFSRGAFSLASVRVVVRATDLKRAIAVLEEVADHALALYKEELVSRPEVISEEGELGNETPLTLRVKARFGQGAQLRRHLLTDLNDAMSAAGIPYADG